MSSVHTHVSVGCCTRMLQQFGQFIHGYILVTATLMAHGGNVSRTLTTLSALFASSSFSRLSRWATQALSLSSSSWNWAMVTSLFSSTAFSICSSALNLVFSSSVLRRWAWTQRGGTEEGEKGRVQTLLVKMLLCIYLAFLALTSFPCNLVKVSFVLLVLQLALQAVPLCCQLLQTVTQAAT